VVPEELGIPGRLVPPGAPRLEPPEHRKLPKSGRGRRLNPSRAARAGAPSGRMRDAAGRQEGTATALIDPRARRPTVGDGFFFPIAGTDTPSRSTTGARPIRDVDIECRVSSSWADADSLTRALVLLIDAVKRQAEGDIVVRTTEAANAARMNIASERPPRTRPSTSTGPPTSSRLDAIAESSAKTARSLAAVPLAGESRPVLADAPWGIERPKSAVRTASGFREIVSEGSCTFAH